MSDAEPHNEPWYKTDAETDAFSAACAELAAPHNPCSVRVFESEGKNIMTLKRTPSSESEVLGRPSEIYFERSHRRTMMRINSFMNQIRELRRLSREMNLDAENPDTGKKAGLYMRALQNAGAMIKEF